MVYRPSYTYALYDPRVGIPRYVGHAYADRFRKRMRDHLGESVPGHAGWNGTHKQKWIWSLTLSGVDAHYEILSVWLTKDAAKSEEIRLIALWRERYDLTNGTDGGDGVGTEGARRGGKSGGPHGGKVQGPRNAARWAEDPSSRPLSSPLGALSHKQSRARLRVCNECPFVGTAQQMVVHQRSYCHAGWSATAQAS
jgi:hypothetical protein